MNVSESRWPVSRWPVSRVHLLAAGRVADQGALLVAVLLCARAMGPEDFAPLGVLVVFNSLAVQLSDLGVGFQVHTLGLDEGLPGRSRTRVRSVGWLATAAGLVAGLLLSNVLFLAAGVIWALSAEAYLRKTVAVRREGAFDVLRSEIGGGLVVLAATAFGLWIDVPEVLAVGLVAKHLCEIALLPRWSRVDPARVVTSGAAWVGQISTFVASNVDYLVAGLLLSAADFSVYVLGFRLVSALPALLAGALTQDAFVTLAGMADIGEHASLHRRAARRSIALGVVGGLAGVGAAAAASEVLGAGWEDVVVITAILALAIPFRLLLGSTVAGALAAGRGGLVIRTELARGAMVLGLAVAGATFGLGGVALGTSIGTSTGVLLLFLLLRRALRRYERSYSAQSQ